MRTLGDEVDDLAASWSKDPHRYGDHPALEGFILRLILTGERHKLHPGLFARDGHFTQNLHLGLCVLSLYPGLLVRFAARCLKRIDDPARDVEHAHAASLGSLPS